MYLVISLFGFEGRIWDLIVSVPDHCLSFYFPNCGWEMGFKQTVTDFKHKGGQKNQIAEALK